MSSKTLEEAKQFLRDNWEDGTQCPCCKQFVKLYKRKLNSSMVQALVLIDKHPSDDYIHVENWLKQQDVPAAIRGDFPKLRYWGLIEEHKGYREDGSTRVGYYRITDKGVDFVRDRVAVPERVKLYNNRFYGYDGDLINIKQALGSKFDYSELVGLGSQGQWL